MILVYLFASVNFQQCFIVENVHVLTKLIHAHVHNARQKYCSCFEVRKVYIIATLLRFSPLFIFSKRSDHDYVGKAKLCINKLCNEKYPAQMLEVAGDLRRAPANFEIPARAI